MNISKDFEKYIKNNYPLQTWLKNTILRTRSIEVDNITDDIKDFAEVLYAWMQLYDWVWLAAPQIGENIRMIAVCQLNKKEDKIVDSKVLINPEIIEKSNKKFIQEEWCLSIPWMEWDVERYEKVKVKYINLEWKECEMILRWTNAGIVQHELDHLDWILFWDKVINKNKWLNIKQFIKL